MNQFVQKVRQHGIAAIEVARFVILFKIGDDVGLLHVMVGELDDGDNSRV